MLRADARDGASKPALDPAARGGAASSQVKIRELRPGMKRITVTFILLERLHAPLRIASGSTIHQWLVADETGSIDIALYDAHGEAFTGGDIIRLSDGYCNVHRNALQLGVGPTGKPRKIGDFTMRYSETPYMSAPQKFPSTQPSQLPMRSSLELKAQQQEREQGRCSW
mmetsp:Transcript_64679/g.114637  ORF Transcript_64679/g.114637 Transcript_64679/m.114637 type:complete len:169 (+) Transcript_64679:67-573(+)